MTKKTKKILSTFIDWNEVAELLGVMTADDVLDRFAEGSTWSLVYNDSIRRGMSSNDAEAEATEIDEREQAEAAGRYINALHSVASMFFGYVDMDVEEKKSKWGVIMSPRTSWNRSADKLRELINGVGMFHFSSLGEFLRSGPYTAKEAVIGHLNFLKRYSDVYGEESPSRKMENMMRYNNPKRRKTMAAKASALLR
jgi:hypothetical protein